MKSIVLLGATGSIGQNTIEIIKAYPDLYRAKTLVANTSARALAENALLVNAQYAAIMDESKLSELKGYLSESEIEVVAGEKNILELCKEQHDITLSAIVGVAGLKPTYACLSSTKRLALANKETLVVAGELINSYCAKNSIEILPVDSEHSAIFQSFEVRNADQVKKITLTASGGPFRNKTLAEMENVTPEQAINHPNWKMGAKISVDSATLLNKGLEYIEAYFLFPIKPEQIDVVIHPQSIIHSMVTYNDGSSIAQLSMPDMKGPISYALSYPKRKPVQHNELDLAKLKELTFYKPDYERFPLLKMSQDATESQGARIILNTANEVAVEAFLNNRIKFLKISDCVRMALDKIEHQSINSLEDILQFIEHVKIKSLELISKS